MKEQWVHRWSDKGIALTFELLLASRTISRIPPSRSLDHVVDARITEDMA